MAGDLEASKLLARCEELLAAMARTAELVEPINHLARKRDELWRQAMELEQQAKASNKPGARKQITQAGRLREQADQVNKELEQLYGEYESFVRSGQQFFHDLKRFVNKLPPPKRSLLPSQFKFPHNDLSEAEGELTAVAWGLRQIAGTDPRKQFDEWRKTQGIKSLNQAAQRIGISRATLKRILAGQSVSSLNLDRFVKVTGLNLQLGSGKLVKRPN